MKELEQKAEILMESLPYIQKYNGKIVVIKYGRNITAELKKAEVIDIVLLKHIGISPVIVHGGGPLISDAMKKAGAEPKFVKGLRVTDKKTMEIVEDVFARIRKDIVELIKDEGGKAAGFSGKEGIIHVRQKDPNLGYVGEIDWINVRMIKKIIKKGYIPVISPIGIDAKGETYNVNADTAAAAIAIALKAEKLTMMTNVAGVLDKGKLISHLTIKDAKSKIKEGVISEGMIPKIEACIYAVENNCPKAHLVDGTIKHSLLLEIFTNKGIGTEIVKYSSGH